MFCFVFVVSFWKRLLWTFIERAERTRSRRLSFCWALQCRSKLDLYCGQVKLWTWCFMQNLWKTWKSHETKCTIPKRISSCLVLFWSAMQLLSPLFLQNCFYSVATHNISLFYCLKSIFSCVNIQEDILCQNAKIQYRNCLWFIKIIILETYTLLWFYFNNWYKDGKDEYFISLFSLQTNVPLRQSLLSIWAASVTVSYRAKPTCSSLLKWTKKVRALREWDDGIVWPLSTITMKQYRFILL